MNPEQNSTPSTAKQQVIDVIKKANNVLITVSQNPNVDQLASCIALTLVLNKLNKHATAIFSGTVPSTIEFLQPEKTLESTTDSLRDFIISLDRDKADKLRYKVEDNVVRIFITPYRTSISQDDLIFSQGDFNVDVVVALGVDQREHLDLAIMQQGRILHDATVIGISSGVNPSNVGAINWHEPTASSISELVSIIADGIKTGLLDAQISTALLTGIVAETDRFRNEKTSAKVMSISAQLMANGANQQLVAQQLDVKPTVDSQPDNSMSNMNTAEPNSFDVPKEDDKQAPKEASVSLHIDPDAPAPAVQLPGELSDDEIKKIKIDEAGIIHDDLPGSINDQVFDKPHKVVQPTTEQASLSTSGYITTPPSLSGTLTASGQDDAMAELPSPINQGTSAYPMLSHEAPLSSSSIKTEPDLTNGAPDDNKSKTSEPDKPIDENTPSIDKEEARKAVLEAVASSPSATPTPIAALNAQPMDLSAPASSVPSQTQLAPPPLPPPITPLTAPIPTPPVVENTDQQPTTIQQGNTPFNLPPP